jgi:hypothetical protein
VARGIVDHDLKAHDKHLCSLVENRQMKTVAELAKDGQYFCGICGRVAKDSVNLCEPVKLQATD